MKPKKPGKDSTSDSGKKQSGADGNSDKKPQWFYDSSQTESEALRAMIGKKKEDEDSKESEKDSDEQ